MGETVGGKEEYSGSPMPLPLPSPPPAPPLSTSGTPPPPPRSPMAYSISLSHPISPLPEQHPYPEDDVSSHSGKSDGGISLVSTAWQPKTRVQRELKRLRAQTQGRQGSYGDVLSLGTPVHTAIGVNTVHALSQAARTQDGVTQNISEKVPDKDREEFYIPPEVALLANDPLARQEAMRYLVSVARRKALPPWRRKITVVVTGSAFNRVVLVLIFANCVFLSLDNPNDQDGTKARVVNVSEYFFAAAFTIEMVLRIMGLGFYHGAQAYLRDMWNVMDMIIVISADSSILMEIFSDQKGAAFSGIRGLRLLRPLRVASQVQQVQVIVSSLFQSLPQLADVMLLYLLFLTIFGIMAVKMWKGKLSTRCYDAQNDVFLQRVCTTDYDHPYAYKCPWGMQCLEYQNPDLGKASFDNIGVAVLTLFTGLTLEGWTEIMYDVVDATTPFACLYFLFVVMVGTFFIINLTLAIINTSFETNVKMVKERNEAHRLHIENRVSNEIHRFVTIKGGVDAPHPPPMMIEGAIPTARLAGTKLGALYSGGDIPIPPAARVKDDLRQESHTPPPQHSEENEVNHHLFDTMSIPVEVPQVVRTSSPIPPPSISVLSPRSEGDTLGLTHTNLTLEPSLLGIEGGRDMSHSQTSSIEVPVPDVRSATSPGYLSVGQAAGLSTGSHLSMPEEIQHLSQSFVEPDTRPVSFNSRFLSEQGVVQRVRATWLCRQLQAFRKVLRRIVQAPSFNYMVMMIILANTVLMSLEHYGQPDELETVLFHSRYIFTFLFSAELLAKMISTPFWEFLKNGFNLLDFVVVVSALLDLFLFTDARCDLSALRAFRLMTAFQLAEHNPFFSRLWVFYKSLENSVIGASVLTALLMLVLFIYALIGMQLFGDKFCGLDRRSPGFCPRENFDSILNALLSVFQIVTGEDWNKIMYNGMVASHDAAALYFISLVIVGNYLVLNLFVAVLFSGLAAAEEAQDTLLLEDDPPSCCLFRICCSSSNVTAHPIEYETRDGPFNDDAAPSVQINIPDAPDPHHPQNNSTNTVPDVSEGAEEVTYARAVSVFSALGIDPSNAILHEDVVPDHLAQMVQDKIISSIEEGQALFRMLCERNHGRGSSAGDTATQSPQTPAHLAIPCNDGAASDATAPMADHVADPPRVRPGFDEDNAAMLREDSGNTGDAPNSPERGGLIPRKHSLMVEHKDGRLHEVGSFLFIPPGNRVRVLMRAVVEHIIFEGGVLLVVLLSSVSLALENPIAPPDTALPRALEVIDVVVVALFTAESLLKIFAYGFVSHEGAYLRRDAWNRLDFFIVVCGIATVVLKEADLSGGAVAVIEIVRTMRTLRPLRLVSKSLGMRLVLQSLLGAIPSLSHVMVISVLILTVFGILGVQLFGGMFNACTEVRWGDNSHITTQAACEATLCAACTEIDGDMGNATPHLRWESHPSNFNNLGSAIITLFTIATLEGWVEAMHLGMDSVGQHETLRMDHRPWLSLYFVVFVVVGSFFLVNLFTGVLVDKYEKERRSAAQAFSTNLTDKQQEYKLMQDLVVSSLRPLSKPLITSHRLQAVVLHPNFDRIVMTFIVLNTVVMALEHSGQSSEWDTALMCANLLFIAIFLVEVTLKTLLLSRAHLDHWHKFDCAVLLVSIAGLIFALLGTDGPALSVFRVLRVARLLRAVRIASGLRTLVRTLILSLGGLLNVAGLLAIFFFVYAVIGVKVFGRVTRGEYLTDRANFDNFGNAVLLLFRMCTGEAWQGIMHDCQVQDSPSCDPQLDSCGDRYISYFYFVSFMIVGTFIILNLIIAVILEDFLTAQVEASCSLTTEHIDTFIARWTQCDPNGTGLMPVTGLECFLNNIGPPLGFREKTLKSKKKELELISRDVYEHDGMVHFKDVLTGCCRSLVYHEFCDTTDDFELPPEMNAGYRERWAAVFPNIPARGKSFIGVHKSLAAMRIQSLWRGKIARKRLLRNITPITPTSRNSPRPSPPSDPPAYAFPTPSAPLAYLTISLIGDEQQDPAEEEDSNNHSTTTAPQPEPVLPPQPNPLERVASQEKEREEEEEEDDGYSTPSPPSSEASGERVESEPHPMRHMQGQMEPPVRFVEGEGEGEGGEGEGGGEGETGGSDGGSDERRLTQSFPRGYSAVSMVMDLGILDRDKEGDHALPTRQHSEDLEAHVKRMEQLSPRVVQSGGSVVSPRPGVGGQETAGERQTLGSTLDLSETVSSATGRSSDPRRRNIVFGSPS